MPIDYSKWDKIELSDDSDIEVHPNVDKRSFINWKQRDIHEKRQQRNIEIKSILVQLTMYVKLNERVDYLLDKLEGDQLLDTKLVISTLDQKFDKSEKFDYENLVKEKGDTLRKGLKDLSFDKEEYEGNPPYNEMIEDLFDQVKEDHPEAAKDSQKLAQYLKDHRAKIDDILSKQTIKLDDLLYQKSTLISSDDIHTGFDRSFLNKDESSKPSTKVPETVTSTETINNPLIPSKNRASNNEKQTDALEELNLLQETEEFSHFSSENYTESAKYLMKHPHICTEQQKDSLIMTAFDHQLEYDSVRAKQIVHQSLLLQYVSQLAGPRASADDIRKAVNLFFSKVSEKSSPANVGFLQDVENTFNHIKGRCEVIREEQRANAAGEEEGLIQLKSLDETKELLVNIPPEGTEEYKIFTTKLSQSMQDAVRTESLDEVNKVFAEMKVEDAEKVLDIFNECGVVGISGYLEDENDFKELKEHYNEEHEGLETLAEDDSSDDKSKEISTSDIVD
ncbi:uncharacterized protein PRCAT00003269001 [Priceomyces carsonii]|uniref:uncharacterized protein n=1 Tax=Priceomyces carsonii TaxID=28549 RepID=UPI002EDA2692|nr:unnamed protein product [Priceomyces carsonii]